MAITGSTAFVVEIQALQKLLAEKDAEIERLKDLLARSSDALENLEVGSFVYGRPLGLIAELRKAAQ